MRNFAAERRLGGTECEYAARMLKAHELKLGYKMLCSGLLELPAIVDDLTIKNRLEAETEEVEAAAKAARIIVGNCNGCDENGNRLVDVGQCPRETTIHVKEWVEKAVPVHIVY